MVMPVWVTVQTCLKTATFAPVTSWYVTHSCSTHRLGAEHYLHKYCLHIIKLIKASMYLYRAFTYFL